MRSENRRKSTARGSGATECRRGSALFLVLGVVAAAAMMGAVVLTTGDSTATATDRQSERLTLRAAAWSGIQAVMAEVSRQRPDLLAGGSPSVSPELVLSDEGSPQRVVVRIVAWEDESSRDERREPALVVAETAKLDLNRATLEMLTAVGVSKAAAEEIVARRGGRPFASVEELATLSNMLAEPATAGVAAADPASVLTTLSFDPNIQAGLGSAEAAGSLRFNVANGWSEALGALITKQLGAEAAAAVKRLVEENKDLKTEGAFAAALMRSGVPKTLWPAAFDLFTTGDDLYVPGRVDLNTAPVKVLAAVPGIGEEHAAAIVAARAQLSGEERKSRVWPLTRDILKPEEMAQAVEWLTTRSMQWRVKVRATIERAGSAGSVGESESGAGATLRWAEFEAVVDAASDRPRLAYLREVTLLPMARAMERRVGARARALEAAAPPSPPPLSERDAATEESPEDGDGDSAPVPPDDDKGAAEAQASDEAGAGGGAGAMIDRRTGRWNAGGSRGRTR